MDKNKWILTTALLLILSYNAFLYFLPIKRNAFYSNEERAEAYCYSTTNYHDVIAGSSLSGTFEGRYGAFDKNVFNLFSAFTGACTSLEIMKRNTKVPKRIFVEINHVDRGVDTALVKTIFKKPFFEVKKYLPILQTRNKLLNNLIDRLNKGKGTTNIRRPPAVLFNKLLLNAQKAWSIPPDSAKFHRLASQLVNSLQKFKSQGSEIYYFEMPMESSISNSTLIKYQRQYFTKVAKQNGDVFIPVDTSRSYLTGDGVHLLQAERDIYVKYLTSKLKALEVKDNR